MKIKCTKCQFIYDIDLIMLSEKEKDIEKAYTCPQCRHKMYNSKKANRVINFFRKYLHHTTGKWYGKKFELLPWEEKVLRILYGITKENGLRLYRKIFVFISKKNGKSEFASGIALYSLFADEEPGAEIYSSAGDREQAAIIFNTAVKMIRMNKKLSRITRIRESTKRLLYPAKNSFYKVLSSDVKTKHGINPHVSIIDELHVITREQYEVLVQGVGAARLQPLIFMITTAGHDKLSICYEEYIYAKKVQNGFVLDESYLPIIFEMNEKDDWKNDKNWKKANPSLGFLLQKEEIMSAFKEAIERPSLENSFRQLRLNQWVSSYSRWLSIEEWDKCYELISIDKFEGDTCFAGLDLSSVSDLTAFVMIFARERDKEIHYYPFFWFWCPEETIFLRSKRDKVPYDLWWKQGWLKTTQGKRVDQKYIEHEIINLSKKFKIQQINIDRWETSQIIPNLEKEGLTMVAFGQGFRSMSTPSKQLEILIGTQHIHHNGNPIVRWMIDNVVVTLDPAGNYKPDKMRSKDKIDGIVALIMGLDAWRRQETSIYEKQGIRTL